MPKFILFILLLATLSVHAQETPKYDVVQMTNGEQRTGHVNEISDNDIKFSYVNETLVYTFKKADISKITFSTGRIEFVNSPTNAAASAQTGEDFHNKVAVLPFAYIIDQKDGGHEMPLKIQAESYDILNGKAKIMTIQDPKTTNALLAKAGVQQENIQNYTMGEICHILNVEFVLQGVVTVNKADNVSSSYGTAKNESNSKIGKWSSSSSTYTSTTYDTNMIMNIYDNKGQRLFGHNHDSLWPMIDAYAITLKYLLKKTPIYAK